MPGAADSRPFRAAPAADLPPDAKRALLAQLLRKKAAAPQPLHPLSDNQQGIWFLSQFAPESAIYNVSFAGRIRSDLDIPAFRRAFQALVDRHPALRTTFTVRSGEPFQMIHDHQPVQFEEMDASGWGADEVQGRLVEETQRPFDLERGPVMRVKLLARPAREHILLLVIHHIVVDFWSVAVILHELGLLYAAERTGRPAALPPLDLHYTDFVRWQSDMLAGPAGAAHWDYWKRQLAGPLPVLDLPTDRPRPPVQTLRGAQHDFTLSGDLARRLRALAKAEGVTLYMVLLAAFEALLHSHSGQDDILVASPMVGRSRAEFEGMVGFLANPVVLRADLSGNPTFRALLGRVRQTVSAALEHQDYPTLRLVQRLRPPRDPSRAPLCQTMFVLDKPHRTADLAQGETGLRMNLAGLVMEGIPLDRRAATLDLVLLIIETSGSLAASIRFNADLFDAATAARMADRFQALLESVIRDPGAAIGDLAVLTAAEREQVLVEFNATAAGYPHDACLHRLVEDQVRRTPDNVAVAFEDRRLSYAQLNARANQLAHRLQALGVGPDVPVAICMAPCPEMVVAVLAVLKAGGAFLPLDPAYPKARLAFMLRDAGAPAVLTQQPWQDRLPAALAGRVLCLDSGWDAIARESDRNPVSGATARSLAYLIYTSGSTGAPKGVMCEHGALVNYLCWVADGPLGDPALRVPVTAKLTFDMCLKQLFPPLLRGGEVWLLPQEVAADPVGLLSAVASRAKVGLNCVPSMWQAMLHAIEAGQAAPPGENLACLLFGGEPLGDALAARSFRALPQAAIWNIYGPTEATANAAAARLHAGGEVTIGRPIANAKLYILNAGLHPVPIGVQGELWIGGAGVARGYLNRPELTAAAFLRDPFSAVPGARMYKTGDLARYRPDGTIALLGRADRQVKIRGFRIELGEIEAALGRHPAVRAAAVVVRDDAPGETRLVAYVVGDATIEELRRSLADQLPAAMIPAVFLPLEALPLLANGKLDRRALPPPDRARPELDQAFVAPRAPREEMLAAIWAQLLDLERVGVHDDFFDLGGHSLLATQLMSRVRHAFQVEIPLRALFEAPTVAGLAEAIETGSQTAQTPLAPPILPVPRTGSLALSFAQQRLWFFDRLAPNLSAYTIPAAIRLKGPLDVAALERSLNEIVKRHESLRTTFASCDGRPTQVIAPAVTITLPMIDLRTLPAIEREAEVRRLAAAEARLPFDLSRGPLLRGTVLRLGDEEHVGLLTLHHIVADGWSTGILIREVATLYLACRAGGIAPLPALPIQYADFAHWQRQMVQGGSLDTQIAYWKKQLAGAPAHIDLPADHPRPAVQTFRGAHRTVRLPRPVQDGFKTLCRQEGVTQFMAFLAAFAVLLHRYTSEDDVIVGTPIANRNRIETEGLIGFFVNALVLRTDLSGNPSFRALLRRVREVCLGAYAHQDLPFDRLVEEVRAQRDLSRNPLFQVMFVLHNAALRTVELPGLTLSPVEAESVTAHFDLTVQIADTDRGLTADFIYNADLFEDATMARMAANFHTLLAALAADPEQRVSTAPLLSAAERRQVLVGWNEAKSDGPRDLCVHRLFEAQVARTPDAVAVVAAAAQSTYGALNRRANQLAHHLRTRGVGPEIIVAICLEPSLEMLVAVLGVLKAGGAVLALDPAYPVARLAFMLSDARAPVLLTQDRLAARVQGGAAKVIRLDSDWDAIARESGENPGDGAGPDDLAYVIYTSGSTGAPKGVLVSHGAIAGHSLNAQRYFALSASDVVLQFASLSVDVSWEEMLPTLIAGGRLVVMGADLWPPADFHRRIAEHGLTVLNLPTAYWQALAREWAGAAEPVPNIHPRLFIVGGEAMARDALALWRQGPAHAIRLVNAYGPTEATITATVFEIAPARGDAMPDRPVPIGRPLPNRAIYILDRHGNPVPIGVQGELHIGGAGMARGYLNRPELTAAAFLRDPFSAVPGARMYKTGDLARYRPDGTIALLGRADRQVKIRGFRIELGEIEAALGRHPAVRAAAVVARDDAPGETRLVAYVVGDATIEELRRSLADQLPAAMIPAVFLPLEALPLLANGKLDRRALPPPDRARPELDQAFVAPRDDLERALACLWEEVLGVRPVGARDNFFALGGHSLLAVRLIALVETRLGKRLPLTAVFQGATVEQLAAVLRRPPEPGPQSSVVALQPGGSKPPLFLVHPAGGQVFPYLHLARCLGPDQPCYGLQARGLEDGQEADTRIADMAAHYLEALRAVQPAGPYRLGGWSMGGVVAFAMAQQLVARGERVALLAMMDGRIPTPGDSFPEKDGEAIALVERYFGVSFGPMEAAGALPEGQDLAFMLDQAKDAGLVPAELDLSQVRRFAERLRSDLRATQSYELHPYPGRITFFKASEPLAGAPADSTMGWSEWALGGVEVHVIPGNHATLMYEPHVAVLAGKLAACLDRGA